MKSLLFQDVTPFTEPSGCEPTSCRTEVPITVRKDGRFYRYVLRDKVMPEDGYLIMVKAAAFAIANGEPYNGFAPDRSVKDFLIKNSVVI